MEVTVVGDKSVYGKIASELQTDDDRETPLKVKLGKLADGISKFGYIGGIAIAVAMLIKTLFMGEGGIEAFLFAEGVFQWAALLEAVIQSVMLAVIIIVMAVPEGLPLMIAIVSAQNMGKMLKDNVLVRKVAGIETAGSLNILFSDKTGTITKGKLEAVTFIDGALNESKKFGDIGGKLKDILSLSIHKNTLSVVSGRGQGHEGDRRHATERAILGFAAGTECSANVKAVGNIPFNSTNKYSATQVTGDYDLTLIKGAPEKILQRCSHYWDVNGEKKPFDMTQLNKQIDELAKPRYPRAGYRYHRGRPRRGRAPGQQQLDAGRRCGYPRRGASGVRDRHRGGKGRRRAGGNDHRRPQGDRQLPSRRTLVCSRRTPMLS